MATRGARYFLLKNEVKAKFISISHVTFTVATIHDASARDIETAELFDLKWNSKATKIWFFKNNILTNYYLWAYISYEHSDYIEVINYGVKLVKMDKIKRKMFGEVLNLYVCIEESKYLL